MLQMQWSGGIWAMSNLGELCFCFFHVVGLPGPQRSKGFPLSRCLGQRCPDWVYSLCLFKFKSHHLMTLRGVQMYTLKNCVLISR